MTSTQSASWDFSPVFDLINSLSSTYQPGEKDDPHGSVLLNGARDTPANGSDTEQPALKSNALGDFGRIWNFLGVPSESPASLVPSFEAHSGDLKIGRDTYASDGAIYYPQSASKGVKWRDDLSGGELEDTQPESPTKLTKTQRKKRNRQLRKAAQAAVSDGTQNLTASESEGEIMVKATVPKSLDRRDIDLTNAHPMPETPTRPSKRERQKLQDIPIPSVNSTTNLLRPAQVRPGRAAGRNLSVEVLQTSQLSTSAPDHKGANILNQSLKDQWSSSSSFLMPPLATQGYLTPQTKVKNLANPTIQTQPQPPRRRYELLPITHRTNTERNWSLLSKLLRDFPSDVDTLLSPLQLSINRPRPNGIHVFIDASNILIGFYEHLKRARGVPHSAHIPRPDLSFHALTLLLERRRPTAKRVLAGSTPEIPAFEQAREVGYETCILDKVWKAKELTERQRRFASRGAGGGGSGSSDNNANTLAASITQRPKWVEQAVDEILHLKILESVVDSPAVAETLPPGQTRPTMVLATGDAAEAEYSSGFMKMVERALGKGWNVELVAWGASVSMAYRRMEKKSALAGRFRVIELDEYTEELFGEV